MEAVLKQLFSRKKELTPLREPIMKAAEALIEAFVSGGKLLVCGNGGSSADAGHVVGELMKGFEDERPLNAEIQNKMFQEFGEQGILLAEKLQQGLPAISLSEHTALITAISNDLGGDLIFAQQVVGYGNSGDILLGLSTSGNAQNVINALMVAKIKGLKTIGMTGQHGGKMKELCDILINVPETRTAYVQELHLPVYHALCLMVEHELFKR